MTGRDEGITSGRERGPVIPVRSGPVDCGDFPLAATRSAARMERGARRKTMIERIRKITLGRDGADAGVAVCVAGGVVSIRALLPGESVFGGTTGTAPTGSRTRKAFWAARGGLVRTCKPFMMADVGRQPFGLSEDICAGGPDPHATTGFRACPGFPGRGA